MNRCPNCFNEYASEFDVCPHCGYCDGQPPAELFHLFPKTILANRYQVGEVLGFGGFGITYKAWDTKLETIVAIKEYYPSGLVNRIPGEKEVILFAAGKAKEFDFGLQRFLDEARNTAKFSSNRNIVHVFEYFEENNTAYIVMEFLDGIPLSQFLKENKMELSSAIETIRCVFSALKEIHAHGIIHRDVSPDNIFLCVNGTIKLIDFGAARFSTNEERQLTIILKPGFAPPEQYEKIGIQGPWTDVYAAGATLYYMLTGIKPDESTDRKTEDNLIPPRELNSEIPENTSNAIMKAMALERHLRFSNIEAFEKAVAGEKKVTTLLKEKKRRKRKRLVSILSVLLILSISIFVLSSRLIKQKKNETLPDAHIILWYEISGKTSLDTAKQQALTSIANDFTKSFPNVTIEIVGVPLEEYLQRIEGILSNGSPSVSIFESTNISEDYLEKIAYRVAGVGEIGNAKNCFYLPDYFDSTAQRTVPIGYIMPILYINTAVSPEAFEGAISARDLLKRVGESEQLAISQTAEAYIKSVWGIDVFNHPGVSVVSDLDGFVAGNYTYYISGSDEYVDIQQKLPGRYAIAAIESNAPILNIADTFSISQGLSKANLQVSIAFVNYLLSDNAQDEYFIQHWTGHLPLNSRAIQIVEDVYSDFSGMLPECTG